MVDLLTENETRDRLRGYIDSKEWWLIPHVSETAHDIAADIEHRYYMGEANADFLIFVLMLPGCFAVSLAKKSRMNKAQLAKIARVKPDQMGDRDVVICQERGNEEMNREAALGFAGWLLSDDGWTGA